MIAQYKVTEALEGNGTAAVEVLEPDSLSPHDKAYRIRKKSEELEGALYVDKQLDKVAITAMNRVKEIVQSDDERTALKASMFVIDHVRGKAVQRTENKNFNLTIEGVLE